MKKSVPVAAKTVKKPAKVAKPAEAEIVVTEPPASLAERIVYSLYLLLSSAAVFFGAQLLGPTLIAFFALGFGVKGTRVIELLNTNNAMRFLVILTIETLTVYGVSLLLKFRKWNWAAIGLGRKPVKQDLWNGLKAYGVYLLIFMLVYAIERATGMINVDQAQNLGFDNSHGLALIFVLFSLVFLPPIAEEIMFRGFIFFGLRKKVPFLLSALLTSVLFAVAHLEFGNGTPLNWAAAIDTFTLSCVLTYAAEKNRSLWPNMFVHAAKNLLAFIAIFLIK